MHYNWSSVQFMCCEQALSFQVEVVMSGVAMDCNWLADVSQQQQQQAWHSMQ